MDPVKRETGVNPVRLVTVFRECKALILADSRKQMGHWETGKAAKCEDL